MTKYLQFEPAEYKSRLRSIQSRMEERGIDAMLVSWRENFRYLTGIDTEIWVNTSRPLAAWIPRSGRPVPIVADLERDDALVTSWLDDIRSYPSDWAPRGPVVFGLRQTDLNELFANTVIEVGRELGVDGARSIAFERGGDMRWGGTLEACEKIREAFSQCRIDDASGILWECRLVKSDAEVEMIRRAVHALDQAFSGFFDELKEGMTEIEVARIFRRRILTHGADHLAYTNVSANLEYSMMGAPTARPLERGQMLYVDGGALVGGYCSDYCRLASIGPATDAQRRAYDVLLEAHNVAIEAVRPGVECSEIAAMIDEIYRRSGLEIGGRLGRHGHGIGLEQPEPPNIQVPDHTVIRKGMVLAIEPNLKADGAGYLTMEDNVVVTDDGCEVLSRRVEGDLPEIQLK